MTWLSPALLLGCGALAASRPSRAADGGAAAGGAGGALTSGPSLSQTGTVGTVGLEGQAAAHTLRGNPKLESRPEKAVTAPSGGGAAPGALPASPPRNPLPRLVEQQVTARLRGLSACRRDVAHAKHVPVAQLAAGSLLLRWTIDVVGRVSGPEVIEQTPVDPAIMECVKRAIATWTFPPPDKGPLSVERHYKFRPTK